MKNLIAILCICCCFHVSKIVAQTKKDTTFLVKEYTSEGNRDIVYIDRDPNSWAYNKTLEKEVDPAATKMYLETAKQKYSVVPSKHRLPKLVKNWYPLHMYKGKYYVYYPSDGCVNNWVSISDSIVLQKMDCEEPYPFILESVNANASSTEIDFKLVHPIDGKMSMKIHVINSERGIAVIERLMNNETSYQLVVDEKKIKKFPIVVNYNPDERSDEFMFDNVDFKKLLKKK